MDNFEILMCFLEAYPNSETNKKLNDYIDKNISNLNLDEIINILSLKLNNISDITDFICKEDISKFKHFKKEWEII